MAHQYGPNGTRRFTDRHLLQIAMPMGGIGAGNVCLAGNGSLMDYSIRNQPDLSALDDGHGSRDGAFALLHVKGDRPITKLVEGPMPPERIYDQGLQGQGYRHGGFEGLPRFESAAFTGEYPFGHVALSHPDVPLDVSITGFNPFIPLDDRNSGLPCAILEYALSNASDMPVECELSFHCTHMAPSPEKRKLDRNAVLDGFGVAMYNALPAGDERFGSASIGTIGHKPRIKGMWVRSGWFDSICALWDEVSHGRFSENAGNTNEDMTGSNGASILVSAKIAPGESVTIPFVLAWYFPNCNTTFGQPPSDCGDDCGCHDESAEPKPAWRPYYAGQFDDAADVATYVRDQYDTLRSRTRAFRDALASTTAPAEVIDAVGSNLAILKSSTVLRQENGNVWAWEGCFGRRGCCPGSCTHVWNYAQAMPHLFPQLERTFREQELERSMDEQGHVTFRSALPDGPTSHGHHPAADGQLGGIMKVYRDWQISGDRAWLERMFPKAKRSMDYCIGKWDPDRRGALFEPHHNTYDIEFWGPDGMCTSIYLGALSAMAAMCETLGKAADAQAYRGLAALGADYMDKHLFNGDYYHQTVMWDELRDQSFAEAMAKVDDDSPEIDRICKAEGPKHQYANGCLSDGVIGAWMADIYGIQTPMNRANVSATLAAIFNHNFKEDLFEHACTQRPGYAMGHEPGLILCTWPRGDRPTLPFIYSDEVWTGIEYQVASHLLEADMVDQAMTIVRGVRQRYDGLMRNPFNEYECGNYYARALASYAVLNSLAGFRYAAATKTLWLNPRVETRPFTTFISTATGWGMLTLTQNEIRIELNQGELTVDTLVFGDSQPIEASTCAQAGTPQTINIQ